MDCRSVDPTVGFCSHCSLFVGSKN